MTRKGLSTDYESSKGYPTLAGVREGEGMKNTNPRNDLPSAVKRIEEIEKRLHTNGMSNQDIADHFKDHLRILGTEIRKQDERIAVLETATQEQSTVDTDATVLVEFDEGLLEKVKAGTFGKDEDTEPQKPEESPAFWIRRDHADTPCSYEIAHDLITGDKDPRKPFINLHSESLKLWELLLLIQEKGFEFEDFEILWKRGTWELFQEGYTIAEESNYRFRWDRKDTVEE